MVSALLKRFTGSPNRATFGQVAKPGSRLDGTMMLTVGEKFERWRIQKNILEADEEQAFCAGHVAGAQHRHDEVHALQDRLAKLREALERECYCKHLSHTGPCNVCRVKQVLITDAHQL